MNETYLAWIVLVVTVSLSIAATIFDPLKIKNKCIGFAVFLCRVAWAFAGVLILFSLAFWLLTWVFSVVTK